jgi:hypothetical protein
MAATSSISNVGDKLIVGAVDTSFLTASSRILPGTAVLNGPVFIGATPQIGIARAACMIGPPFPGVSIPTSLEVTGVSNFYGVNNIFGTEIIEGLGKVFGSHKVYGLSSVLGTAKAIGKLTVSGKEVVNGKLTVNGVLKVNGVVKASEVFNSFTSLAKTYAIAVSKKGFDIKHPTKDDHRLRYICIEGPAAEVYLRGTLKNNNVINLPEYWRNLVDAETIGVTLTPIGVYQELLVEKIEWGTRIVIKNNLGGPINCSYIVFAERKDTDKNIPEYKGLTPDDYPGDNNQYNINSI